MLTPAEQMDLLRQHWGAQAARGEKPSCAWITLSEAGELVGWALTRRTAEKTAAKRGATCHVARLDPKDY